MAETLNCRKNGFGVDMPHDLTDVLFLPAQRTVRLDLARVEDSLQQVFVQPDLSQVRLIQRDQLFAEFLQCDKLAFSCAFAGL